LASGARTILSNSSTPTEDNPFSSSGGITLDSANNRVLMVDGVLDAIVAVDLATGARTILSDNDTPTTDNAFNFSIPNGITLDSANNRALVVDAGFGFTAPEVNLAAVVAVDIVNGQRVIFSR